MIEIVETARKSLKARKLLRRTRLVLKVKNPLTKKKKPVQKRTKPWKFKKSELNKLDSHFSMRIRTRDGYCLFPGCTVADIANLQCSHYEGRARWETRFDEDNCIALCWSHHFKSKDLGYEYQKQRKEKHGWDGQYTLFMKQLLGETRFQSLMSRPKVTRKEAMKDYATKCIDAPPTT